MYLRNKKIRAFGLIKLSIVLMVIGLISAAALSALNARVASNKVKLTNYHIKEVYKAMQIYLLTNKRLPCPASMLILKGVTGYGAEVTGGVFCGTGASSSASTGVYADSGTTSIAYGAIPTQTLALPSEFAEDAYGTRLAYMVHKNSVVACEATPNFSNNNFCTPATGSVTNLITVNQSAVALTSTAIFAVISYGPNKSGGFNPSSTTQITRSSDTDEAANDATATFDAGAGVNTAGFNNVLNYFVASNNVLDDIVFFKTRDDVVKDSKGLFLIPCAGYSDGTYTWPATRYDAIAVSSTVCTDINVGYINGPYSPSRKCGAGGAWGSVIVPCS